MVTFNLEVSLIVRHGGWQAANLRRIASSVARVAQPECEVRAFAFKPGHGRHVACAVNSTGAGLESIAERVSASIAGDRFSLQPTVIMAP